MLFRSDRVGCFAYSNIDGAKANELNGAVPEELKQERVARFMEKQAGISAEKLKQNLGKTRDVIIDDIGNADEDIIARTTSDAPDIDGLVYIEKPNNNDYQVGDITQVTITHTDEYDMRGKIMVNG